MISIISTKAIREMVMLKKKGRKLQGRKNEEIYDGGCFAGEKEGVAVG